MDPKIQTQFDVEDLQKEVIEMRQQIPLTYRTHLEIDYEKFKERITNIISQRNPSFQCNPDTESFDSVFESSATESMRFGPSELKQYVNNVKAFCKKVSKDGKVDKFKYGDD